MGTYQRLVCAALALASLLPANAVATTALPSSDVRLLPTTTYHKEMISASSQLVVWGDYRRGENNMDLYGFDLVSNREIPIAVAPGQQRWPDVSGDTVVWWDSDWTRPSLGDIKGYRLSDKKTFVICDDPGEQRTPEIDGSIVVWEDFDSETVRGMDLSTYETFTVGAGREPDVAGDWIVYTLGDPYDFPSDIRAYNLKTKENVLVTGTPGRETYPRVGADGLVVWQSEPESHSNCDVMGRYLGVGGTPPSDVLTVAAGPGRQASGSRFSNMVVYGDSTRPGGYTILGYDLLANTRFGMVPAAGELSYWSEVEGGVFAYLSNATGYKTYVSIGRPTVLTDLTPHSPEQDAVEISEATFPGGAPSVVMADAGSWTDQMTAASLTATRPLLLTSGDSLSSEVASELVRLAPKEVLVVGGPASVSETLQAEISSLTGTSTAISRLAGVDAKATSLEVAKRARVSYPTWNGTVIVTSKAAWSSALVASPIACYKRYPLVFVNSSSGLSTAELRALKTAGAKKIVVIGGTGTVSSTGYGRMASVFGSSYVSRIAGTNRYDTSARVAKWGVTQGLKWNNLGIASGSGIIPSVVQGPARGRSRGVLLLTDPAQLSPEAAGALRVGNTSIRRGYYVGAQDVLSTNVRKQVRLILR